MMSEAELEAARARARARAAQAEAPEGGTKSKAYKGMILPFSTDEEGNSHFDSDAGIVGSIKRAVTLPRDTFEGKVDLNTEEGTGRVLEAATFGLPMNPAVRAGDRAIPGVGRNVRPAKPPVPTADELHAQAAGEYDAVRGSGVDYRSNSVADLAKGVRSALQQDGILDVNAPQTHKVISMLTDPPKGSVVEIQHLEAARRAFGKIAQESADATERGASARAVRQITEFIERADPQSVVAGPAAEAGRTIGNARSNYAAASRSDDLTGIQRAADLRAAAANSGQNVGNSTRSRLASLLLNKEGRDVRGYTPEEIAAIEGVVNGSRTANGLRRGGNILGGGGGMATAVVGGIGAAGGAMVGGPAAAAAGGAIPPIIGATMKAGSNALTRSALRRVDAGTRGRSALMQERIRNAPNEVGPTRRKAALMRALLLSQQGGNGEQVLQD